MSETSHRWSPNDNNTPQQDDAPRQWPHYLGVALQIVGVAGYLSALVVLLRGGFAIDNHPLAHFSALMIAITIWFVGYRVRRSARRRQRPDWEELPIFHPTPDRARLWRKWGHYSGVALQVVGALICLSSFAMVMDDGFSHDTDRTRFFATFVIGSVVAFVGQVLRRHASRQRPPEPQQPPISRQ